ITALSDYFPIKKGHPFYERYLNAFNEKVINLLPYIKNNPEAYLRTDTHLSFEGKVITSSVILNEFMSSEINFLADALNELRGDEYEYLGDLGSKIEPKECEVHYKIRFKNIKRFDNMVGANDGLCHVYFNYENLNSKNKRRLLVFSVSFMKRMLQLIANF